MKTGDTKERLLMTAIELIWGNSYGSVSVDDICERAGVKKGSFYHFFPSKCDLAVAAFEDSWQKHRSDYDRVFSTQTPPLDRLAGYCDLIFESQSQKYALTGKVCGCPYASLGSEVCTQEEKIRLKSQEVFNRIIRYLETTLRDAAREGVIEDDNSAQKARELFSFVEGVILQAKIQNNLELVRQLKPGVFRFLRVAKPAEKR